MADGVSVMVLLLLCVKALATIVGPSPQTILVPHRASATVQFTCTGPVPDDATRIWRWMVHDTIYTTSSSVRGVTVTNTDSDTLSTLALSLGDIQPPLPDVTSITCIDRLVSDRYGIVDEPSNITATLASFGPLLQPTISHNATSVLVQWISPLPQYDLWYRILVLSANNETLCLNSTTNSTKYTIGSLLMEPGCSTVGCTQYRANVSAFSDIGEGPVVNTPSFMFPRGNTLCYSVPILLASKH